MGEAIKSFRQSYPWIIPLVGINQLPVSATRWQHGSQFCFASYLVKIHKGANNSTSTEAREKISTYLESENF